MTSCASASRAPEKVSTTSVPRCPPRGMMPVREGEAEKENEPQRHREHREKKHRENQRYCFCIFLFLFFSVFLLSVFSVPLWFVFLLLSHQLLPQLSFIHDDDRP